MSKSIKELTAEINMFVDNINTDLKISSPSKLLSNIPLSNISKSLMGFSSISIPGLTNLVTEAIEQQKLLEQVAHLTNKTTDEIKEFCATHSYSLEMVRDMVQAGATLNKEGDFIIK